MDKKKTIAPLFTSSKSISDQLYREINSTPCGRLRILLPRREAQKHQKQHCTELQRTPGKIKHTAATNARECGQFLQQLLRVHARDFERKVV
jgi:hypothetical protein